MKDRSLDILFLTETRAHTFHSFMSQSYKFIVNGSIHDPYAGITAIISSLMIPYVNNIVQLSPRILEVSISAQSGTMHVIGIYAPHSGLSLDQVRVPFWDQLQDHVAAIPQPEPWYVIGDFNVRLQGETTHRSPSIRTPYFWKRSSEGKCIPPFKPHIIHAHIACSPRKGSHEF